MFFGDYCCRSKWVDITSVRKFAHISYGVCNIFLWPFYTQNQFAPYWSCVSSFVYFFVFIIIGFRMAPLGVQNYFVRAFCRGDDPSELLYGPISYVLIVMFCECVFWNTYPPSVIGLSIMIFGDGVSEYVGKNYGKYKLLTPWNSHKTLEGSISVAIAGFLGSLFMCYYIFGQIYVIRTIILSILGSIVEFYSPFGTDNFFIPLSCVGLGYFMF
ncbi:Phosphatidate cytidylyltransferase [Entamoeba marina]